MITLRLFKAADPFQQIEARKLAHGEIIVGRDRSATWAIEDVRGDLSRRHCVLSIEEGRIQLCDTSTNGVFIGASRRPAPRGEFCEVPIGESIYLGEFMILFDAEASEPAVRRGRKKESALATLAPSGPAQGASPPPTDAALLEAFCRGAGLEASSFAGEDPQALMGRLGVVYRQAVDDLCALMRDRAMHKDQFQMERTTISARDNNPLKWAAPQRIAVDLLKEGEGGFLKGADAFREAFADVRRHTSCLLAGSDAALRHVLESLEPGDIEDKARSGSYSFFARSDAAWKQYRERYARLADPSAASGVEQAFRQGYERHLRAAAGKDGAP